MSVFSEEESALLDQISVEAELERLTPPDRAMIELRFLYRFPDDYTGLWPAYVTEIVRYARSKSRDRFFSATSVQHRIARILETWRQRYHPVESTVVRLRETLSASSPTRHPSPQSEAHSPHPLRRAA